MTADDSPTVPDTEAVHEALAWLRGRAVGCTAADDLAGWFASSMKARVCAATVVRWAMSLSNGHSDTGESAASEQDDTQMLRELDKLREKCGDTGEIVASEQNERGHLWWTETRVYGARPKAREIRSFPRNPSADPSPRSWSLPAPPPDDVTVVHVDGVRYPLDTPPGDPQPIFSGPDETQYDWHELLAVGTVVEGEPQAAEIGVLDVPGAGSVPGFIASSNTPAPEPQAGTFYELAVLDRFARGDERVDMQTVRQQVGALVAAHRESATPDRTGETESAAPERASAASEPPRFERGFYRLARDLDDGGVLFAAGSLVFLNYRYADGWQVIAHPTNGSQISDAALAAAGAVRVEEEQA